VRSDTLINALSWLIINAVRTHESAQLHSNGKADTTDNSS